MWSVQVNGAWQSVSTEQVRDWIQRGLVGPQTVARHDTWRESAKLGHVQAFAGLFPGVGQSPPSQQYGPAPGPPLSTSGLSTPDFVEGLFDLSLSTFVTTRVVKVLYVLFLLGIALSLLGGVGAGFMTIAAGDRIRGALEVLLTPLLCLFALIYGRVIFECIVVFFRIAEHIGEINSKTKG